MATQRDDLPQYPALFESGWSCFSWIIVFLFFTLIGNRAPDDRFWERMERHGEPVIVKPLHTVPRWARPGIAAFVAALAGAGTFFVYRDGGFAEQSSALACALAALAIETLYQWFYYYKLWFRVSLLFKLSAIALYVTIFALYAPIKGVAAWLYSPQFVWGLYTLLDTSLVLYMNRERPSELAELAASAEAALDGGARAATAPLTLRVDPNEGASPHSTTAQARD